MGQQFHFRVKASFNTRREDIEVIVADIKQKTTLASVVAEGKNENAEDEDSDEENHKLPTFWNCYFLAGTFRFAFLKIPDLFGEENDFPFLDFFFGIFIVCMF